MISVETFELLLQTLLLLKCLLQDLRVLLYPIQVGLVVFYQLGIKFSMSQFGIKLRSVNKQFEGAQQTINSPDKIYRQCFQKIMHLI